MTITSASDLALLRSRPQETNLYLSIYKPNIVFAAQVNDGGIAVGERQIDYDNVVTGSWSNIVPGMTMYVGTTENGNDKGRVRVKNATGTYVNVAENSHIDWNDDQYITVKDFHEIWSIFPVISAIGTEIIEKKDYDVDYINQNTLQGALTCAGSHYAGFIGDQVFYSATGTYAVNGDALTYEWDLAGTLTGSSTALTPGYVTYDEPGHYTTTLTVTNASGGVDKTYRHISIYRDSSSTYKKWGITEFSGSRSQSGFTAKMWLRDNIDDLEDGALVVIFADDTYGTTAGSIGGNSLNRPTIVFVGYILEGTIDFNWEDNSATFEVGSPTEVMKKMEVFPISLEDSTAPTHWYEMLGLTVTRGLWEFLSFNCTVNEVMDTQFLGSDVATQYFDTDKLFLTDALQQILENTVDGIPVSDRQGKLWMERKKEIVSNALTNIPISQPLNREDWINTPNIIERQLNETSYLEVGGILYSGASATGTNTLYLASAPGDAPDYAGKTEQIGGLQVQSLQGLLDATGDIFASRNSRYPEMTIDMSGNYRNLDIAPLEALRVYMDAEDNPQNITLDGDPFAIDGMGWIYDTEDRVLRCTLTLSEVTEGYAGEQQVIPVPPITNSPTLPPIHLGDFTFPTFPPIYSPPTPTNPPPRDLPPCVDDVAFLPFQIPISGTMESTDCVSKKASLESGRYYFKVDGANFPTSYSIDADWLKRGAGGVYADTLDDDFYHIYALDLDGNRIVEATKDPVVGSGKVRTGVFKMPANTLVGAVEMELDCEAITPSVVGVDPTFGASGGYAVTPGTFTSFQSKGRWIAVAENYIFDWTAPGAPGAIPQTTLETYFGANNEYLGRTLVVAIHSVIATQNDAHAANMSSLTAIHQTGINFSVKWTESYSPAVKSATVANKTYEITMDANNNQARIKTRMNGTAVGFGSPQYQFIMTSEIRIQVTTTYRVKVRSFTLSNVCAIPLV